jgi:hypothetical protein
VFFAAAVCVACAAVVPGPAAHAATSYAMRLSSTSATLRAGAATRTTISFYGSRGLYRRVVDLSVSGLPEGVTASFSPPTTRIDGRSRLTLHTAASSPAGAFTITVTAITEGSDPIGTSTTFDLTIAAQ